MSSDSDRFVFQQALEEQDNSALFQAKRWTHVVDSSSSGGVFNSQLQWDLNTLASQNSWTDLSQGFIQFPVKVTISGTTKLDNITANAACIKNGFHNFVDSVQLVLGGSTIQTSQIYTNIDTSFKILTEWSQDELHKYGPSLGIALDDYDVDNTLNLTLTEGAPNTVAIGYSTPTQFDNITATTFAPALHGAVYPPISNTGFKERVKQLNTSATAGLAYTTCNTLYQNGKSSIQTNNAVTTDAFVAFYLATIRLKDICDSIAKLPPIKNLKGYLYVNYNSATTSYTATASTGVVKANKINKQAVYGRTMPVMVDRDLVAGAADSVVTIKAEISGVESATLTSANPPITNGRLYVPYYVASPEVDRALSQKKTIRYNERFVTTVNIGAGASTNVTITPGISNPKRLIMLPVLTGDSKTAGVAGYLDFPELSPFDIATCGGSSPFAMINQLQVSVGNQPIFQEPVSFDHHMFMEEVGQCGRDGGLDSETGSGLLSQRLWNQMYRYYTVDIGRRLGGDDGASKSIQLSCNNPCANNMRLICIVWYEREIEVDTALGVVTQGI